MRVISITFTVLASLHSLVILLIMLDIGYNEYLINGEVGLAGFVRRLTIFYVWVSLIVISVLFILITRWKNHVNQKLNEANWLISGTGIALGSWVTLPLIFE